MNLSPLTFFEFLDALGETGLRSLLEELREVKAISEPFHTRLTKLLKYYLIVGGMPEAVAEYIKSDDFEITRMVQKEILDTYTLDFAKHAPPDEVMKIMAVWELVPSQLAKENKKFIFTAINKSARAKTYESSIQWLVNAGLILKSHHISTPRLPLDAYANRQAFKIFVLDVGLLGAMSRLDPKLILEKDTLFKEFNGALTENYVAQEIHQKHYDGLYYWSSSGTAEVDFVISLNQKIFPLEVKAGVSKQKKSLLVYGKKFLNEEYSTNILSRATLRNFALDGNILNYPLYAVSRFPLPN